MKQFKKMFTDPSGTKPVNIMCFGNWEQHQHRKFMEPTKARYQVLLVDKHRTSCRCNTCKGKPTKKFAWLDNPWLWRKDGPQMLRHGLVKCKFCTKIWNHNTNATFNIWKIACNAINGLDQPNYLVQNTNHATT